MADVTLTFSESLMNHLIYRLHISRNWNDAGLNLETHLKSQVFHKLVYLEWNSCFSRDQLYWDNWKLLALKTFKCPTDGNYTQSDGRKVYIRRCSTDLGTARVNLTIMYQLYVQ